MRHPPNGEILFCADHVEFRRDGDRRLLVEHPNGRAFSLNRSGVAIAERLLAPTTLPMICDDLVASFDVDPVACAAMAEDFVGNLRRRGFLDAIEASAPEAALRRRYLDLLARTLVNLVYPEHELRLEHLAAHGVSGDRVTDSRTMRDIRTTEAETLDELVEAKIDGRVWRGRVPSQSHTMVGLRDLQSLERCAARVFADGVAGDFLEAGVCQGGASIFLRGLQVVYGESERCTWLADSFEGLPPPTHPMDVAERLDYTESVQPWLSASLQSVEENFRTYDVLSDRVRFLEGWFADTLPSAPIRRLAILRVDADLYASTYDALEALYDKVSPGGYVVIDDYHSLEACRTAVDEFRTSRAVREPLRRVSWSAVLWRKTR